MPAWAGHLLLAILLISPLDCARISQRLVGGHAKVEPQQSLNTNTKNDDTHEEKKTLSQQVAEGKYGLIQKELFDNPPKRLGVLSYEKNSDVPKDNENSLGGLGPDEIWLAEDHLLVLKGGSFHRTASELPWPPIDDYRAPNRQVKIPSQPKVPPPFPVQLTENGPLQFFGINITRTANGSLTIPGPDGSPPIILPLPGSTGQDPSDPTAGRTPFELPPYIINGQNGPENYNKGNGYSPFPFPYPPPPPPNLNQSLDEDDPSIYYPPPYSFFYPKDNTTKVAPGPLVPGIVLPPPPDFFGPLEPETSSPTSTTTTTTSTTTPRPEVHKPPIRYLPSSTPSKPTLINVPDIPYHENELITQIKPVTTIKPVTSTESPIVTQISPIYRIPYSEEKKPTRTRLHPTAPPKTTPSVVYSEEYEKKPVVTITPVTQSSVLRLRPTTPLTIKNTTPITIFSEEYEKKEKTPSRVMMPPYGPTNIPVIKVPKTYLRPTTTVNPIPVVQVSYGGGNENTRPRTYLKPATGSTITNTVSPVPVLQVPYLKANGQVVHTSPISVQYLPYNTNKDNIKPTQVPPVPQTISPSVVRIPTRTQVSSTAVPLKTYYSDLNTNSVQPHAEYYFYEEDSTPPPQVPQRLRYVSPSNFEKHIQVLRQKIQSYLKPSSRPVYEYSFQAANYRPTKPPARYLTPAPQTYITQRPIQLQRYQQPNNQPVQLQVQIQNERDEDQHAYYTKQDERLLDDITKKYFTVFGQKITTPVTPSLSLGGDTLVNYRKPRPPINHEAEYINIRPQAPHKQTPGEPGTFISYALPGEGAHFYFLTPQLVQQQRQQQEQYQQQQEQYQQQQQQQNAYYYDKPENPRIRRRNQR